jgi:hypothetical protein
MACLCLGASAQVDMEHAPGAALVMTQAAQAYRYDYAPVDTPQQRAAAVQATAQPPSGGYAAVFRIQESAPAPVLPDKELARCICHAHALPLRTMCIYHAHACTRLTRLI